MTAWILRHGRLFPRGGPLSEFVSRMSLEAAESIARQLRTKPGSTFALPTGRTPLATYALLSQWSADGRLDWSEARCFALDEYIDVETRMSFSYYLETHLYKSTNLRPAARHGPLDCDDYDALIALHGGLDLTMVGIGHNGHIAFNEPGTPAASFTHCVWLTESTRQANAPIFGNLDSVPRRAITVGLQTILASRMIILIASGNSKKAILGEALNGPVSEAVPASLLQRHPNLLVLTDFDWHDRQPAGARQPASD